MGSGDLAALADLNAAIQAEMRNHVFVFLTRPVCACGADLGEISEPPTMGDRSMMEIHRTQVTIGMVSERIASEISTMVIVARTDQRPGDAMKAGRDMAARHAHRYAEAVRSSDG